MKFDSHGGANSLALITISFNPCLKRLSSQIKAIPNEALLIVVDNASAPDTLIHLKHLVSQRPNSALILNAENEGLAAAINRGARFIREHYPAIDYLLLMDQDSIPAPGAVQSLLNAHFELKDSHPRLGCVGPLLLDTTTGLSHGFHQIRGWRWTRIYPRAGEKEAVPCANLNGSGTLVSTALFEELGGLDETFFIDHVDTDWAFRVLASDHELLGIPWAWFDHAMGEKCFRFWIFGWRVWPHRSPRRHYYLFRNAVRLLQRSYVPRTWKIWAALKLLLTLFIHLTIDPKRLLQAKEMLAGCKAGFSKKNRSTP